MLPRTNRPAGDTLTLCATVVGIALCIVAMFMWPMVVAVGTFLRSAHWGSIATAVIAIGTPVVAYVGITRQIEASRVVAAGDATRTRFAADIDWLDQLIKQEILPPARLIEMTLTLTSEARHNDVLASNNYLWRLRAMTEMIQREEQQAFGAPSQMTTPAAAPAATHRRHDADSGQEADIDLRGEN